MEQRPLGPLQISVIGFGAWGIGGLTPGATSYGETDDASSRRALHEALDCGITFFDTSSVYGDGRSETLIGEVAAGRRERMVIATKGGITPGYGGYDFSADALRASLEGSLRRLRTDYVDLFQLHNAGAEVVGSLAHLPDLLERFRAEGKIRAFGFSTPSPEDALTLIGFPAIAGFQVNCNLLDWRAIDIGLFDRAARQGLGIIARTPLAFGFLAGKLNGATFFNASDHRSKWPRERIALWVEAADAVFAALGADAAPDDRAVLAMRFCLSFPAVATVIPGMVTPQEVRANVLAAAQGPLDADEIGRIETIYRRYEARLRA